MSKKAVMHRHSTSRGRPKRVKPIPPPLKGEKFPRRNEPCHCGSGKKYKKCCLLKDKLTRSRTRLIATDITHFGDYGYLKRYETGEYIVTTSSIVLEGLDEAAREQIAKYYKLLSETSSINKELLDEIVSFQQAHNEIPQSWNLLNAAYQAAGQKHEAERLISEIYQKFPHYFFAKLNMAIHWLYNNEMKKADTLLSGKHNVKEFEPSENEFHISAVENFHHTMVLYCLEKGNLTAAKEHRKTLNLLLSAVGAINSPILAAIDSYIAEAEELDLEEKPAL
jgi:hypothetical protein